MIQPGNWRRASTPCRQVVSDFVKRRQGDRVGLIAFGDAPYPLVPFTLDHLTVQSMIESAIPGIAGPRTALGDSIGLAIKMFAESKAPEKVLVVLTDGNDTASSMPPDRAADIAKQETSLVHTVGIGDPDATGEDKLDVGVLCRKSRETTGGRYFFGQDQSQLAEIYAVLDAITPANQTVLSWRPKIELFHYPLGAALLLLIGYHALAWALDRPSPPARSDGQRGGVMDDFHFLRPWWLSGSDRSGHAGLARFAPKGCPRPLARHDCAALLDHLLVERQGGTRLRPVHLVAILIALGAIAVAGPTWQREQPPFVEDKAPLALVIDLSQTMNAIDITPSRLERVKLKVQDLLKLRPGARTAVFAYAGSAHMVLPLTDDARLVKTYVNSLQTRIMPVPGKDTAKALQTVEKSLSHEQTPGTILFLTDGIEPAAIDAFKRHEGKNEIMVLGVGTAEGGPVKTGGRASS